MGILVLFLDPFTTEYDVSSGFVIYGFYFVEVGSLYTYFLESCFFFLNHKWMVNFIKSFFWIYEDDYMGFIFQFAIKKYLFGCARS